MKRQEPEKQTGSDTDDAKLPPRKRATEALKTGEETSNEPSNSSSPIDGAATRKEPPAFVSKKPASSRPSRRKKGKRLEDGVPKKPLSAYNIFFRDERSRLLEDRGKGNPGDLGSATGSDLFSVLGKAIGKRWGELSEEEKAVYTEAASKDKERYRKEMEVYSAAHPNPPPKAERKPPASSGMVRNTMPGNESETKSGRANYGGDIGPLQYGGLHSFAGLNDSGASSHLPLAASGALGQQPYTSLLDPQDQLMLALLTQQQQRQQLYGAASLPLQNHHQQQQQQQMAAATQPDSLLLNQLLQSQQQQQRLLQQQQLLSSIMSNTGESRSETAQPNSLFANQAIRQQHLSSVMTPLQQLLAASSGNQSQLPEGYNLTTARQLQNAARQSELQSFANSSTGRMTEQQQLLHELQQGRQREDRSAISTPLIRMLQMQQQQQEQPRQPPPPPHQQGDNSDDRNE